MKINTEGNLRFQPICTWLYKFTPVKQDFVLFADCRNKRYALVITDIAKATAFFNSHDDQDIEDLHEVYQSGNRQLSDEKRVKNVIGTASTNGISFYSSDDPPAFQSWTLLNN